MREENNKGSQSIVQDLQKKKRKKKREIKSSK